MKFNKLIGVILIVIAFALLISDFDDTTTLTAYILYTLAIKITALIIGYIGIHITFKPSQS